MGPSGSSWRGIIIARPSPRWRNISCSITSNRFLRFRGWCVCTPLPWRGEIRVLRTRRLLLGLWRRRVEPCTALTRRANITADCRRLRSLRWVRDRDPTAPIFRNGVVGLPCSNRVQPLHSFDLDILLDLGFFITRRLGLFLFNLDGLLPHGVFVHYKNASNRTGLGLVLLLLVSLFLLVVGAGFVPPEVIFEGERRRLRGGHGRHSSRDREGFGSGEQAKNKISTRGYARGNPNRG